MLNVLVIDDSKTLRVGLAKMLREMGHTVTLAENGQQGVERFREQRPGLVLLDVTMPVMDGYATAREMRAQVLDDWVPIIFLSGSEDDQDLERAIEAGGDDYLVKPVSFVVLSAKIHAMCRIEQTEAVLIVHKGQQPAVRRPGRVGALTEFLRRCPGLQRPSINLISRKR